MAQGHGHGGQGVVDDGVLRGLAVLGDQGDFHGESSRQVFGAGEGFTPSRDHLHLVLTPVTKPRKHRWEDRHMDHKTDPVTRLDSKVGASDDDLGDRDLITDYTFVRAMGGETIDHTDLTSSTSAN
jgi:hypothetical protein